MFKWKERSLVVLLLVGILLFSIGAGRVWARAIVTFGPQETKLEGSIKYAVLGRYTAHFKNFSGRIVLDDQWQRISSVNLEIDARSIASAHPRFDRLARSRRLLYAQKYPKIIFNSTRVIQDATGDKVQGVLEIRGIKRKMAFPFVAKMTTDQKGKGKLLYIHGSWDINRKDFNIVWNKYLDHGGVLVSDIFTVYWGIKVKLN